jgi:hypothetical protein
MDASLAATCWFITDYLLLPIVMAHDLGVARPRALSQIQVCSVCGVSERAWHTDLGAFVLRVARTDMDRFELADAYFSAPTDQKRWPLTLTVTSAETYASEALMAASPSSSGKTLLVSFASNDRDWCASL